LAEQLLGETALNDKQRLERAYLSILTRRPDSVETDEALTYIRSLGQKLDEQKAWQSYLHILLTTSEFLYSD
jgi:hypothetical protein